MRVDKRKLTRKERAEAQRNKKAPIAVSKKSGFVKNRMAFPGLFIAIAGFLLYANTLQNDFALDDISAIKKNWVVKQGITSFPLILNTSYRYGYRASDDELYRPLPLMVFATLWQLFPGNPFPYHLLNVLLYALTGLLLFRLLRKIFGDMNPLLPFLASLFFIVHPLHTEVVANIKSLDEILSFLFVLLTIDRLLLYVETNQLKILVVAWFYFFLAFMCKEGTVVMLIAIPLVLAMFTVADKKSIVKITLLLSSAALIFIGLRAHALGGLTVGKKFLIQENVLVSAPGLGARFATIFFVLLQHIRLMIAPFPLSSDYSFRQLDLANWNEPLPWISIFIYTGLLFIALKNLKKNRIISFSILFFLVSISLYSNILMTIGSLLAERFLYVPMLGFAIFLSWLLLKLFRMPIVLEAPKPAPAFALAGNEKILGCALLLVIPYSFITVSRNADWKDTVTLFAHDVVNAPNSALLHFNYGNELKAEKAAKETDVQKKNVILDSAIVQYKRALEIYPGYNEVFEQLGLAYYYRGMDSAAFTCVNKAIEADPLRSTAYNSLGTLYFEKKKDYKKALELYLHAVRLNPNYIDGWRNAGAAYGTLGQFENALDAFQHVLRLDPVNAIVLRFTAQTYQAMGDAASSDLYARKAREAEKIKQ